MPLKSVILSLCKFVVLEEKDSHEQKHTETERQTDRENNDLIHIDKRQIYWNIPYISKSGVICLSIFNYLILYIISHSLSLFIFYSLFISICLSIYLSIVLIAYIPSLSLSLSLSLSNLMSQ